MSLSSNITATERVAFERLLTMADVDCRRGPGRSVLRYARALSSDLGGDLSIAQQMLVQRASLLAVLCGHTEAAIMLGRPISVGDYLQMTSTLRRLLTTLSPSLQRVPRDVTPEPLEIRREDLARKLAERGLPAIVFGVDTPVLDSKS
jgi:hypothetical protein